MNSANYSIRPGEFVGFLLGGRAVLLSSMAGIGWLVFAGAAMADESLSPDTMVREVPISSAEQTWLLWIHACFFGLTWGARGPMITAKTADLFQGRHLGAILGVISIGTGLGAAIGAWASGLIFDLSGSYRLAFILSILSYLAGCVAFWFLRRPPVARA